MQSCGWRPCTVMRSIAALLQQFLQIWTGSGLRQPCVSLHHQCTAGNPTHERSGAAPLGEQDGFFRNLRDGSDTDEARWGAWGKRRAQKSTLRFLSFVCTNVCICMWERCTLALHCHERAREIELGNRLAIHARIALCRCCGRTHCRTVWAAPTSWMGAGASFIDVEELTEALEQDFARVVPRTPRGSLDVASCDRGKVRQVVDGANERIKERYVAGWQSYTARKGAAVDELRDACAALVEDFHEAEPRCALPANTPSALVDMASRHGAALHAALEGLVTKAGGEYVHGPTKKVERIKEKAENDYEGDVARVVDVERATGLFDSLEALNTAASAFRGTIDGLTVRRCKDAFFAHKHDSGYRDMKLFVEVADTGFIGELQLNLRRIQNIKGHAHKVYDVERVLEKGTDEALRRAIDGLDLESEQVLCLAADGGQSILDACGHVVVLEDALDEALPAGCEVANVYNAGGAVHAHVRLGIADVAALARLRDAVLFEGSFENAINAALPRDASQLAEKLATSDKMKELGFSASVSQSGRCLLKNERFLAGDSDSSLGAPPDAKIRVESVDVHVDRGAFMECYARIMMRFAKLTMHQREKLTEVRGAKVAVLARTRGRWEDLCCCPTCGAGAE